LVRHLGELSDIGQAAGATGNVVQRLGPLGAIEHVEGQFWGRSASGGTSDGPHRARSLTRGNRRHVRDTASAARKIGRSPGEG
jgi:hypothetical protein